MSDPGLTTAALAAFAFYFRHRRKIAYCLFRAAASVIDFERLDPDLNAHRRRVTARKPDRAASSTRSVGRNAARFLMRMCEADVPVDDCQRPRGHWLRCTNCHGARMRGPLRPIQLFGATGAMVATVTLSNVLVQFPVELQYGVVNFAGFLTWGAFTYPLAFLVSDLTNRHFGSAIARLVATAGFAVAIVLSIHLSTPRIALASGLAFLMGQFVDIALFSQLRNWVWFVPPFVASLFGSALDTLVFFSLAFAPAFAGLDAWLGVADVSQALATPPFEIGPSIPAWSLLAAGDFIVKFVCAVVFLVPYRLLMGPPLPRRVGTGSRSPAS